MGIGNKVFYPALQMPGWPFVSELSGWTPAAKVSGGSHLPAWSFWPQLVNSGKHISPLDLVAPLKLKH